MASDRVPLIYRATPEQLERLKRYAAAHGGISRHSAISVALTRELDRWEVSQLVPQT